MTKKKWVKGNADEFLKDIGAIPSPDEPTVEPDNSPTLGEQTEEWEQSHWFKPPKDVENQILTDEEFNKKYGGQK